MHRWLIIGITMSLGICGCASAGHIIMKNPQTGAVFECKGDPWQDWDPYRSAKKCAEALRRDGWQQLGSDAIFQKSSGMSTPKAAQP
jgi:hypothetical protein